MKAARVIVNTVATLGLAFVIARFLGTVNFAPWATTALVRVAAFFGAYGDEHIEDFYMLASFVVAIVVSGLIVWSANRAIFRQMSR
jgi:uncharacterized membrane protein YcaP (DUF421 family)